MIVLDASVIVELLLGGEGARRIAETLAGLRGPFHAPGLLDLEVLQVLRRYDRNGELDGDRGRQALRTVSGFPLRRHSHRRYLSRIWALRGNLTAYDAAYVALAEGLDATLLTRDAKLAASPGHGARIELV